MPMWYYLSRPTNLAFHKLTLPTTNIPSNIKSLLGLGLKFIPSPKLSTSWKRFENTSWIRLKRDLAIRCYFASNSFENDPDYNPRMHWKSTWNPPTENRSTFFHVASLRVHLKKLFKRRKKCPPNLLPHQQRTLNNLRAQNDLLIVNCDKNLGPAIIEKNRYTTAALEDHLLDNSTYLFIRPEEREVHTLRLKYLLREWLFKFKSYLNKNEIKFLRKSLEENKDPLPQFYLTYKVHKKPLSTRPIVSCSGSILHPLGIWVDNILQTIAKRQKSYFKSSFTLLTEFNNMDDLPHNARLFTADAVSMYTNIPTTKALHLIKKYLQDNEEIYSDIPTKALMSALTIIMTNNIFDFGNTTWLQIKGTAMGTPPAPPYATIYYAIHEITFLSEFNELIFYRRFIDDVFGIWIPSSNHRWTQFQIVMNSFDLEWEFSKLSTKVNFMDLTIHIDNHRLSTTLFEKDLNLYLYLPPHSSHPPGLITGMVMGGIYRIHTLCSDSNDRFTRYKSFYRRLLARGWKKDILYPLFHRALKNIEKPPPPRQNNDEEKPTFLFLEYNPADPKSYLLQQTWRNHFLFSKRFGHVNDLKNNVGVRLKFNRLIIAYKRRQNLGNLLSYRRLTPDSNGRPTSSFLPPNIPICPSPETREYRLMTLNRSHTPGQRRMDDFFPRRPEPRRQRPTENGSSADEAPIDSETNS